MATERSLHSTGRTHTFSAEVVEALWLLKRWRVYSHPSARWGLLLANERPLVSHALRSLLESACKLTVVGEARSCQQAVEIARVARPDVLVFDLDLPGLSGVGTVRKFTAVAPLARLVALTGHGPVPPPSTLAGAGIHGCVPANSPTDAFLTTIKAVVADQWVYAPEWNTSYEPPHGATLTLREQEVLIGVTSGEQNKAIARRLGMSLKTVEFHLHRIYQKLRVNSRTQAAMAAARLGLVQDDDAA